MKKPLPQLDQEYIHETDVRCSICCVINKEIVSKITFEHVCKFCNNLLVFWKKEVKIYEIVKVSNHLTFGYSRTNYKNKEVIKYMLVSPAIIPKQD